MINHKGTDCLYKPITCQEGYCSNCQIYLDYQGHQRSMGRNSVTTGNWRGNNIETCLRCGADRTAIKEMLNQGTKADLTIVNTILENCLACKRAIGGVG